jgi:transcriptional regulator with XRE-family HTH domain
MLLAQSVGELLEEARKQSGLTMNEVAEKMNVSRGRINQLEQPDANLEVATVTRMAQAMGYKVTMTLEPKSANKVPLKVELV